MLVGSDPWAPEGVAPQKSEAKLFHKLQQLPCYTWASSPFLQLTEKVFLFCLFSEKCLGFKEKKKEGKFKNQHKKLHSKSSFLQNFDNQQSDKMHFNHRGTCLKHPDGSFRRDCSPP